MNPLSDLTPSPARMSDPRFTTALRACDEALRAPRRHRPAQAIGWHPQCPSRP
jgi:hypothetical protein